MKPFEVFDLVTGETLHSFRSAVEAHACAKTLNKPHADKMYGVRTREG